MHFMYLTLNPYKAGSYFARRDGPTKTQRHLSDSMTKVIQPVGNTLVI